MLTWASPVRLLVVGRSLPVESRARGAGFGLQLRRVTGRRFGRARGPVRASRRSLLPVTAGDDIPNPRVECGRSPGRPVAHVIGRRTDPSAGVRGDQHPASEDRQRRRWQKQPGELYGGSDAKGRPERQQEQNDGSSRQCRSEHLGGDLRELDSG